MGRYLMELGLCWSWYEEVVVGTRQGMIGVDCFVGTDLKA